MFTSATVCVLLAIHRSTKVKLKVKYMVCSLGSMDHRNPYIQRSLHTQNECTEVQNPRHHHVVNTILRMRVQENG